MKFCFLTAIALYTVISLPAQTPQQQVPDILKDTGAANPAVIKATRAFRERLLTDPYRPAYHFSFPEDDGRPGDPNGAFYYNGLYHLMYLYKKTGSGFAWGHVSSPDLIHWRYHPDAIVPGDGDEGCFSGGAFVDSNGVAILSYWMLWGAKGIGLAKSMDPDFNTWKKFGDNPVIRSTEWGITEMKDAEGRDIHVGSADPSNIWRKNGKYYMLTGSLMVLNKYGRQKDAPDSEKGDRLYLFESTDLKSWKYLHRFYERNTKWTEDSEDNMCPSFLPLPVSAEGGRPSGKHLLLFISHNKGCQYYTGKYQEDKFLPETHGRMTWVDNAYFAPEALMDGKGRQIMWSWIFDDRPDSVRNFYGWTGIYGLPRTLWLGEDNTLRMRPVKELEALRGQKVERKAISIRDVTDLPLEGLNTGLLELEVTIDPGSANHTGVLLNCSADGREQTAILYDAAKKELQFDATRSSLTMGRRNIERAPLTLQKGEKLKLRIFIDKGIIEVFANDRQAIGRTVYPTLGGKGIKLFTDKGTATAAVKAWELYPANPY